MSSSKPLEDAKGKIAFIYSTNEIATLKNYLF